jgi:hypothetical protein
VARERAWLVRLEGFPEVSTGDLTLDEVALAEQVSGSPYTLMNPHASVKVAKALLVLMLKRARMREGHSEADAEAEALRVAGEAPLRTLHGAFVFVPGDGSPATDDDEPLPPSSAPTSATG